jgi:hypothetical protein
MSVLPTQSEYATFQVLANKEFVNFDKQPVSREVVEPEEDDYVQINMGSVQENEDEDQEESEEEEKPWAFSPADLPPKLSSHNTLLKSKQSVKLESARSVASKKSEKPPPSKYKESTKSEIDAEKEGLLSELQNLERQGLAKLVKPLSMNDSLEEIQFQYDRIQIEINANQIVDMAKSAIKMGSGMLEMGMKKAGIQVIDGYHTNLCKDMSKFNRPLNRLYKKYWRRGGMTPEMELGVIVFGSLAWTVVQNKMGSVTAGFGGDVPAPPPPPSFEQAPSQPFMRPPQMNSMDIPSSWAAPPEPDAFKLKEEELRRREQKLADDERRRAEQMKQEEQSKRDEEIRLMMEKLNHEETPSARVVQMSSPKGRKKSAINLDD